MNEIYNEIRSLALVTVKRLPLWGLGAFLLLTSCDKDVFDVAKDPSEGTVFKSQEKMPISDYLAADGRFSEYVNILKTSKLYNALNLAGSSFTALAPTDEAIQKFEQNLGGKIVDQPGTYASDFVLYHTLAKKYGTKDFIMLDGTKITNLSKDEILVSIDTLHSGEALLTNSTSTGRVVEMGDSAYNGFVYVLSEAMTPLTESVYDRIKADGRYGIMLQALQETGWADKYATVSVTDGTKVTTYAYTVFGVTDATFNKEGINSLDDLKNRLVKENTEAGITPDSLLKAYIGYHTLISKQTVAGVGALNGSSTTRMWDTGAKNLVLTVDNDTTVTDMAAKYTINKEGTPVHFVESGSNVLALNGYLHEVDNWMPVWEPQRKEVVWDLADNVDIKNIVVNAGCDYQPETVSKVATVSLVKYGGFIVKQEDVDKNACSYATIKPATENNKKTYNLKDALHNDCVVFCPGNAGTVMMTTPTLVRGKYKVTLDIAYTTSQNFMRTKSSGTGGTLEMYVDRTKDASGNDVWQNKKYVAPYTQIKANMPVAKPVQTMPGTYTTTLYDEITFDKTTSHEIYFIVKDPQASQNSSFALQFDVITFTPIE